MLTIEERVRTILQKNSETADIYEDVDFDEELVRFGFNSITYIKFLVLLETEFGIEFVDDILNINFNPTIRKLVVYIENEM